MGLGRELYRGTNDFDFPKVWRFTTVLSVVLVLISVVSFFTRGIDLSIDFEGGSVWEIPSTTFTQAKAEETLAQFGPNAAEKVQEATTTEGGRILRVSGQVGSVAEGAKAADALAEAAGLQPGEVKVNTVGPSWGEDITSQARLSLIVFMVLIALYITWRLEAKMAVAALVAVVHDIIITVGVYSVFQIEVTPATVISFLTILGFSLYDTIVVYDRVQENGSRLARTGQYTYTAVMRRSLNQVFMRSLNTTLITIIPVLSVLIIGQLVFGQASLGDFSLALLIGLISGTYSSLFVAAPLTVVLKEREPRWREVRAKLGARGADLSDTAWYGITSSTAARGRSTVPARPSAGGGTATATRERAATDTADGDTAAAPSADPDTTTPRPAPAATFGGHPPRPRKKKKR
ncbi:MAG: protein translocase subunit SecF [Microthrixaceae bacterium]